MTSDPTSDTTSAMEKVPLPPGVGAMFISQKNLEKYGLLEEDGKSVKPFKLFPKSEIMEEIQKIGFYSDFFNFRDSLKTYDRPEILVASDPESVYGENFILALTGEAYENETKKLEMKAREKQFAVEKKAAEDRRREEEERAILTAVYEDRPIVAGSYHSLTLHISATEVQDLTVKNERPLIRINISKAAHRRNGPYKFSDKEAADTAGLCECRPHKDPNFDLSRVVLDAGFQANALSVSTETQTSWFRSINNSSQYTELDYEAKEREHVLESHALVAFLRRVQPKMEEALQQNETLDPFVDEFSWLAEDEIPLGNKSENIVKELRTFTDLVYSKNKSLSFIDWHPVKKGVLAVSATSSGTLEQRIEQSGKAEMSYVLVWNFRDLIHPQFVLESPGDVYCVQYNPTMPHLIAGGSSTGQVVLWDLSTMEQSATAKQASGGASSLPEENEEEKTPPPISPASVSFVEGSHRRPVADIAWLPAGVEVNSNGNIQRSEDGRASQFITVAGDGQVCIWDVRYKEQCIKNPRMYNRKPNKDGTLSEIVWIPIFRTVLTKIEGVGEFLLSAVALSSPSRDEALSFSSQFFCGTEEGELVYADWKAQHSIPSNKKSLTGEENGSIEKVPSADKTGNPGDSSGQDHVLWCSQDHFRPCLGLRRSPFHVQLIVSVGDWSFNLWKEGLQLPIFSSPISSTYLSCAAWSPTRPSVLMVGRIDGNLDVWDLADQSHKPALVVNVAPYPITSLQFWWHPTSGAKQQLLAVGDANGNLHILDLPRNLWRPIPNEQDFMEAFIAREVGRVEYLKSRQSGKTDHAPPLAIDNREQVGGQENSGTTQEALRFKTDEALEAEYQELEAQFRQQFSGTNKQQL